jgi:hypothetical protein
VECCSPIPSTTSTTSNTMASAFSALKPPTREDRIAAAKKDGSFDGKRDAYNKAAKAHGLKMDEGGLIKRQTLQEEFDEERGNRIASPEDKSFHGKRDAYNKSAKARRLGLEVDERGIVRTQTFPSRDQIRRDNEKYEDDPRRMEIRNQIDTTQRLIRRTQHLLNAQRLRSSGRHKEAATQKHLHDQLLPDEDERKRGAKVFQSP